MSDSNQTPPSTTSSAPRTRSFKPRANIARKTKAERDAHAKQEAEKAAARAAVTAQAVGKSSQGGKSTASKKKDQSRDARENVQGPTGGVFGVGTGSRPGSGRRFMDAGRSEMLEGQEGVKPADGPRLLGGDADEKSKVAPGKSGATVEGTGSRTRGSKRTEDGVMVASDDEIEEPNRDIERIWISSDDDDEGEDPAAEQSKGKARAATSNRKPRSNGGLRPVRAPRTLVEEQEPEAEKGAVRKTVKSSRTIIDDAEGDDDEDRMEIVEDLSPVQLQTKHDVPSSPELSKRSKVYKRSVSRVKDARIATETLEERAERIRLNEDVEKLKYEFASSPKLKKGGDATDGQRDVKQDTKMFLFQFPPLIPFLRDPSTIASGTTGQVDVRSTAPAIKTDPDGPSVQAATGDTEATEPSGEVRQPQMEGSLTASEPLRLPSGRVGKLRIHKSGKVSLDWGGTDMEVRYGTEVDFLQDAVLVENPAAADETEDTNPTGRKGTAYALGHVQKKMIVIPDWQKLYD